jgi:predicted permease
LEEFFMSWLSRLTNAFNPRRLDEDLADEMADHLERRAAALNKRGLNTEEAHRQARVRFGNTTHLREESRGIRLWAGLEGTLQDVRYAWRGMRKGPVFAATAVLSLALAIGANTAIYSIVDAAILRPLPVPEPGRLFTLSWPDISDPGSPAGQERDSFSYPEYLQFTAVTKGAARLALFTSPERVEAQGPNPDAPVEKINRGYVSGEAFDILGVPPAVGRLFSAEDDSIPQSRAVAVLSYDYWRRRFQADPAVVGRNLKITGKVYAITGVAREGFFGVEPGKFVDVWLPGVVYGTMNDPEAFTNPGWHWFRLLGRFAPGALHNQIQARLQPSFHHFQVERVKRFPTIPAGIRKQFLRSVIRVHAAPAGASTFRKTFSRPLWIVFGVGAGILLIACANVASLLLARSTTRATEMAMRVSLGAARGRLVRQMLTESLTLSLIAGGLGWLLARTAAPLLANLLSTEGDPVQFVLAIDTRVLLFCIAVSTASAVLFGLIPAWQASGVQPMLSLRASAGQAGKLRLGKIFVSIQVACAFCLVLVGAAFLFSLHNLLRVNPGFDARNLAVLNITTEAGKKTEEVQRDLMFQLHRRMASQLGVQAAAIAMWPIFQGTGWSEQVIIPGKGPSEQEEIFYRVSPGYFAALQTPLAVGRDFRASDSNARDPAPAIVNEAFARKYFNSVNVLGREFSYPREKSSGREVIIGIASDARYYDLRKSADPIAYLPVEGSDWFTLYVRSPLKLGTLARLANREARAIGSGMRIREVTTLETIVGNTLLREKLLADVGGAFAFFGLLLAAIGLFGLLSYSVGRRTKEIGIRAALGARRIEIVSLILKDVSGLMSGGLMIGLGSALAIMTLFRSLLFGIQKADPFVIGTAIGLFLVTGLLAAWLPAHRAATVDPMSALREE